MIVIEDSFTREGAEALAEQIRQRWAAEGQDVQVSVHPIGFMASLRTTGYVVRSNMKNGLPLAAYAARKAERGVVFKDKEAA